jgi:hypothetical protein
MTWHFSAQLTDEPTPELSFDAGARVLIVPMDLEATVVRAPTAPSTLYLRPDDDDPDQGDEPDLSLCFELELYRRRGLLLLHPTYRPFQDDLLELVRNALVDDVRARQRIWLVRRLLAACASPLDPDHVVEELHLAFEQLRDDGARAFRVRSDELRALLPSGSPNDRLAWWRAHEQPWRPTFGHLASLRDAYMSEYFSAWERARLGDDREDLCFRLEEGAVEEVQSWRQASRLAEDRYQMLDRWFRWESDS